MVAEVPHKNDWAFLSAYRTEVKSGTATSGQLRVEGPPLDGEAVGRGEVSHRSEEAVVKSRLRLNAEGDRYGRENFAFRPS